MKVRIEDGGPCRKVMHVEVPAKDVASEFDSVLQNYTKYGKVPGFRPGKAPAKIIERHYAKSITDDTKDRLVPKYYREALKENSIEAVAIVNVGDIKLAKDQGMAFSVTIDVAPDFKLPKYKKVTVKENAVSVDQKEVDATLKRILDSNARFDEATGRAVADGDLVSVDYKGELDGAPISSTPELTGLGEGKDFWILCGSERELLPGMSAGLLGMSIGDTKDIKVRFPDDHQAKPVAGKEAKYHVVVNAIRQKITPPVDAEFLKRFDVDSESALKEKIRKEMLEHAELTEKARQKDEIASFLLKETDFDLPVSLVEQETDLAVRNMVQRFARQGATKEQIVEHRNDIVTAASKSSKDRVKLSYILSRIATEEKIEVPEGEVEARMESMAKQYEMPIETLRAELEKRNALENLRSDIRNEKTMSFLLENAKLKK